MQASFGGSVAGLAAGGKQYAMVVAQPPEGCSPLTNDPASVKGAIVLIQRGAPEACTRLGLGGGRRSGARACRLGAAVGSRLHGAARRWAAAVVGPHSALHPPPTHPPTRPPPGNCTFSEKALAAQDGGAAGVLIYDNVLQVGGW